MTIQEGLAVGGVVIAVVTWLLRLESTVRQLQAQREADMKAREEQRAADLRLLASERAADLRLNSERLQHINTALENIQSKLEGLDEMKAKVDQIRSFVRGGGNLGA